MKHTLYRELSYTNPVPQDGESKSLQLSYITQHRKSYQMRRQRNMLQTKEQYKTSEKKHRGKSINKEFKVMTIKMLTRLQRQVDQLSEKLNEKIENIKQKKTELKNTIM